jgi:hypothetical protein
MGMDDVQARKRVEGLLDFLSSPLVSSINHCHPNDLGGHISPLVSNHSKPSFQLPATWDAWWDWAASERDKWHKIIKFCRVLRYPSEESTSQSLDIPAPIQAFLSDSASVSLPRDPETFSHRLEGGLNGKVSQVSQKKHHEVTRMSSYVFRMLDRMQNECGLEVKHVVDIGSGQVRIKFNERAVRLFTIFNRDISPAHFVSTFETPGVLQNGTDNSKTSEAAYTSWLLTLRSIR